jgi:hypothetical protein
MYIVNCWGLPLGPIDLVVVAEFKLRGGPVMEAGDLRARFISLGLTGSPMHLTCPTKVASFLSYVSWKRARKEQNTL